MRTIAIVNQKGGCGKTTIAINLAAELARRGQRTLLVDMDPQSHCAAGLGVPESSIEQSLADALPADPTRPATTAGLVWEVSRNLDLLPSTMRLAGLEAAGGGLHDLVDKDLRLARLLAVLNRERDSGGAGGGDRAADGGGAYAWCLIDCPPTIGLLTYNALRAATEALIPVETGYLAFKGAEKQWMTIQRLVNRIGRALHAHLVPTLHDPELELATQILASLRRRYHDDMAPVVIETHNEIRLATSYGQPVIEYAPASRAAEQFAQLADWLEGLADHLPGLDSPEVAVLSRTAQLAGGQDVSLAMSMREDDATTPGSEMTSTRGERAADVARRVRQLIERSHDTAARRADTATAVADVTTPTTDHQPGPPTNAPSSPNVARPAPHETETQAAVSVARPNAPSRREADTADPTAAQQTFGVFVDGETVRFVQPATLGRSVCIAGNFNHWSPTATPLRPDGDGSKISATITLRSGRHQYRLVVDGRWMADPHNATHVTNEYGEPNSVVDITPRREIWEHDAQQ